MDEKRRKGVLQPSDIRRDILPLLESTLASGNLVHARKVLDAVGDTRIPPEDIVRWHKLNALLAAGAGDLPLAENHAMRLLAVMETDTEEKRRYTAGSALTDVANLIGEMGGNALGEFLHRHILLIRQ